MTPRSSSQRSSTVRPVTRKLPESKELWDDLNLPLCVVLSPADHSTARPAEPHKSLCDIPRCLYCGAPHSTRQTHFRPKYEPVLVCYLCGKTSSTQLEDQQEGRPLEVLFEETYDREPPTASGEWILPIPLPLLGFSNLHNNHKIPAMACPPVWWIVLDASVPAGNSYWKVMTEVLSDLEIPDHVHVGILAVSSTTCSVYDLSSRLPHVLHYPLTAPHVPLSLVPADTLHTPNIQAAIQAMNQTGGGAVVDTDDDDDDDDDDNHSSSSWSPPPPGMVLTLALEIILDFMEPAWHPGTIDTGGSSTNTNTKNKNVHTTKTTKKPNQTHQSEDDHQVNSLRYAGGKISCFLARPPMEIVPTKNAPVSPAFGPGGVAGACVERDVDLWENAKEHPDTEPTDWTASNLAKYVDPLDPEDMLFDVGAKCARAALGVDLVVIVPTELEPNAEDKDLIHRPYYGLPLLAVLTNASGTPGPLMFGARDDESTIKAVKDQVLSRVPWQEGMIWGTQVRSRITKGFDLEDSPIPRVGRSKLQLVPYLSAGGLSGPGVLEEKGMWVMGSCDVHTSVVVDYQILDRPDMVVTADGMGQIALKPVLQICVAYTCVEKDEDDGDFYTVRKMKISNMPLPIASDSEPLYDAMDPEALALVLFQKLALNAVQDGFVAAQDTAQTWLKTLLVRVYQSAQVEQAKIEERTELKPGSKSRVATKKEEEEESKIVVSNRLLDIKGGDLSEEEILLGQGHSKIAVMPLIVYSLMQCDALRPTMGTFAPSMDSRCAAVSQMYSMNPSNLSKCIAPSLQLWSTKQDRILMDSIDLNRAALEDALKECNAPDAVFFLDSPQQILVYRADQGMVSYSERSGMATLSMGPRLAGAIQVAAKAYRSQPIIRCQLKAAPFSMAAAMAFDNVLLEDCPTYSGNEDYKEWIKHIADEVHAELLKSGDIIS